MRMPATSRPSRRSTIALPTVPVPPVTSTVLPPRFQLLAFIARRPDDSHSWPIRPGAHARDQLGVRHRPLGEVEALVDPAHALEVLGPVDGPAEVGVVLRVGHLAADEQLRALRVDQPRDVLAGG